MVHAYIMNWATASYVSRFVSLFGISTDGEVKSKYVHGAILFLEIQKLHRTNNIFLIISK